MSSRFGEKLRNLRLQRLLSQAELARQLKQISQSYLSYLEAGRKLPSLDNVIVLANFFSVTTDYFLRDTIAPEQAQQTSSRSSVINSALFSERLRFLRKQQQWTQTDLAARLPVATQAYISLLEAGRKKPSPEFIVLLAELFGVSTDHLLGGDNLQN